MYYHFSITRHLIFVLAIITIAVGCRKENRRTSKQDFFTSQQQVKTDRIIRDTIRPVRQFDLIDLGVFNDGDINVDDKHLYISDVSRNKILKIKRNTWSVVDSIGNGEGQGPGQSRDLNDFSIHGRFVYIPDPPQRKIMIFRKNGEYIKKINTENFRPEETKPISNYELIVHAGATPGSFKFYIIDRKGKIIDKFIDIDDSKNPLRYNGDITINEKNETIYFSDFTEPIIKGISFDGNVDFSMDLINNFNPEGSYTKSGIGTETVRYSYSEYALYASADLFYIDEKIFLSPLNNEEGDIFNFLDVYDTNGSYKYTIYLGREVAFTDVVIASDGRAYAIEQHRNEGDKLFVYNLKKHIK